MGCEDPVGCEPQASGGDIIGCTGGLVGPLTMGDGAEPLPLPNPQAGQTGEAPGATSITVAQRGHFRRGKGTPRVAGDRATIGGTVLKAFQALRLGMPDITHDDRAVKALLAGKPRIAVVGASDNPARDSNSVFAYMKRHGYEQVPVNPMAPEVHGVKSVPDLAAAAQMWPRIDIVDVFRAPDQVGPIVDAAIAVKAKAVWFQLGVVNPAAIQKALDAGLDVVVDRCIKVEHTRLLR